MTRRTPYESTSPEAPTDAAASPSPPDGDGSTGSTDSAATGLLVRESHDKALIGQTLGSYRIVKRLGHGGMGVVFLAEHEMLGSSAVVKMLHPDLSAQKAVVDRFFNEAKAATRIKHPGIIQIFDFGFHKDSGSAFIVMELLEGETLSTRIQRLKRLQPEHAMAIARQVASALTAAHKNGIIHRDLKPDNLFLVPDPDLPDGERIKILDFGIAKLIEAEPTRRTRTGDVFGTPLYMSPEQCRNAGNVDARTDIYALGCIVYEMLIGHPPFVNEGLTQLITAHMFEAPVPPRELIPTIPDALEQLVLRALAKAPDDRQPSMSELARTLDDMLGRRMLTPLPFPRDTMAGDAGPVARVLAPSTTLGRSAGQVIAPKRSRQAWTIIGLGVAIAAVVVTIIVELGRRNATPSAETAVAQEPLSQATRPSQTLHIEPIVAPAASSQPPSPTGSDASGATAVPAVKETARASGEAVPAKKQLAAQPTKEAVKGATDSPTTSVSVVSVPAAAPSPAQPTTGVLSLGSKPPCEIYIDGKPSGLRTPQLKIELAPGDHVITLVNPDFGIKDSFSIAIGAGEHVRTSRDFSDRIERAEVPSRAMTINPFEKK